MEDGGLLGPVSEALPAPSTCPQRSHSQPYASRLYFLTFAFWHCLNQNRLLWGQGSKMGW